MKKTCTSSDLASFLNLPAMRPRDAFEAAVEMYRGDPLFCIPQLAREVLARAGKQNTRVILLGTKDFAAVAIAALAESGAVMHVVDDFRCHRGELFHGVSIISTDRFLEMCRQDTDIVAINSCRYDFSRRFFENLCRHHAIPCLNWEQACRLLQLSPISDYRVADWAPTISERFEEFEMLSGRLGDEQSRDTLHSVLGFHLTCNPEWHLAVARPYCTLYFRSGLFSFSDREKMVDCGASIGESTSALIGVTGGRFSRSWMIEPDRFNVQTLEKLIRSFAGTPVAEKLSLHAMAASDAAGTAPFHHQGGHGGSIAANPDAPLEPVRIGTIDDTIDDLPTFIKMDIEGYEAAALRGAEKAIRAARPKLALSAYHRADDLLELPAYIDRIAPGYTIGLRHHTEDRWDTCLYLYDPA